jgi:O-glycosyl hydrolase
MVRVVFIFSFLCLLSGSVFSQSTYRIDASKTYQTIDNFSASDCWTAQFFGHFPDAKRNQMADWLFSMETDAKGQPAGIGLSLWRFNIGAGSAAQGKNSYIPNVTRRAECFQLLDGSYDWNRHAGQQWFLRAAKERGVQQFLAFSISAPIQMTMNGLANNRFRPDDGTFNLKPDKYGEFADFLATVADEVGKRNGVTFQYISPFNEPEWNWSGNTSQEGTPALMSEIAKTVRLLDEKITEKGLNTKIMITESGQIDYLFSKVKGEGRDNQIETFFNPSSPEYVGNLTHVPKMMVAHSYWTTEKEHLAKRKALREKLDEYNLDYWQTELCIMSNDKEIGGGRPKDMTMKTALYVARVIHHDLCVAHASAWHWWLAITNSNYKDGLVYVTPNEDLTDGEISDSKLLWTVGNFSRFVRPGAKRADVTSTVRDVNDPEGLMVSSYIDEADKSLVIVAVNYSEQPQEVKFDVRNAKVKILIPYTTSDADGDNLKPDAALRTGSKYHIPARAVVTFVGNW